MTATDKTDGFRAIAARFRMALLLSDLTDAQKVIAVFLAEHLHQDTWRQDGRLVTWIGVPTTAALLGLHPRTVKACRATLREAGILTDCHGGGHGPGDTARLAFSMAWLEDIEAKLHRGGQFARIGKGKGGKGGRGVTLDPAATLPGLFEDGDRHSEKGGRGVTLSNRVPQDAKGGEDGEGDSPATLATLGNPKSVSEAVDKSTISSAPVDSSGPEPAVDGLRVAMDADKGDGGITKRVTVESPEPVFKQGSNPARARARDPRRPGRPPIPSSQLSIMLPIDGGPLGRAVAKSRAAAAERSDRHLEELLERASALLGNRGQGNLAVSALQSVTPDLYQGLLRGQTIPDIPLHSALRAALDAVQRGDGAPGTAAAPAAREPCPTAPAGLNEVLVASTVTEVLAAMVPAIVAATLERLRVQRAA